MAVIRIGTAGLDSADEQSGLNDLRGFGNRNKAQILPVIPATSSTTSTVTVTVTVDRPIIYFKRGWHIATSQFEHWQTEDPLGAPPSGNSLIDVSIVGKAYGES